MTCVLYLPVSLREVVGGVAKRRLLSQTRKFSIQPITAAHSIRYGVKLSGWTFLIKRFKFSLQMDWTGRPVEVTNGKHPLTVTESDSLY